MIATFALPMPPSVNALFANVPGRGRIKTRAYRSWIKEAGWALRMARVGAVTSRVRVLIEAGTNNRRDADNLAKPILDLLKAHGVLKDDSAKYVAGVSADWNDDVTGCRVTLTEAAA